jgi:MHS family proline/betaine transporter-like MFS transporter
MIGMAIPTLVIGLLPATSHIGIWAPIILSLCRIVQGICSGGELNGAMIFCAEHFPKNQTGRVIGLISSTGVLGVLLAMSIAAVLTSDHLPDWSWRLAFMIGAVICWFGASIRLSLEETPAYKSILKASKIEALPLKSVLQEYKSAFVLCFFKGALTAGLGFTLYVYLPLMLKTVYTIPQQETFIYGLAGLVAYVVFCFVGGVAFDRYPNHKPLLWGARASIICCPFIFYIFQSARPFLFTVGLLVLGAVTGFIAGSGYPFLQRLFPAQARYTGISLGFTLGGACIGSSGPLVMLWADKFVGRFRSPMVFIGAISLFFLIAEISSRKGRRYFD